MTSLLAILAYNRAFGRVKAVKEPVSKVDISGENTKG